MTDEVSVPPVLARRHAQPLAADASHALPRCYALIVGITTYEDGRYNLNYAAADAKAVHRFLLSDKAVGFAEDRIRLLVDQDATLANIQSALRSFLQEPGPDDFVLIYLACHGWVDPRRKRGYLLTHDVKHDNLLGTALRMGEIVSSLQDNLVAERVVILADACYSGILTGLGLRGGGDQETGGAFLADITASRPGVALLAASGTREAAQEGDQWGGHGVFTHFVLRGLEGDADGYGSFPRDGKVSLGELFAYVKYNVSKAVGAEQNPISNEQFDPGLPISFTAGVDAERSHQLGHSLLSVAYDRGEARLFVEAAARFAEATSFSRRLGRPHEQAELGLARADICAAADPGADAGRLARARDRLLDLVRTTTTTAVAQEAHHHLGVVQAMLGETEAARRSLLDGAALAETSPRAGLARAHARWLEPSPVTRRRALLIGVDRHLDPTIRPLNVGAHNVHAIGRVLGELYGFEVRILVDQDATRARILAEFAELAAATELEDVIVHYSGQSAPSAAAAPDGAAYLLVHDTSRDRPDSGITARELHRCMCDVSATRVALVLDTHTSDEFTRAAEAEPRYAVLQGTVVEPLSPERWADGGGAREGGSALSVALGRVLGALAQARAPQPRLRDLLAQVEEEMTLFDSRSRPLLLGQTDRPLLSTRDPFLDLFDLQQRGRGRRSVGELRGLRARLARAVSPLPAEVEVAFGQAFLGVEAHEEALEAFTAASECAERDVRAKACLGRAQVLLRRRRYSASAAALRRWREAQGEADAEGADRQLRCLERLAEQRAFVLCVGVARHLDPSLVPARGADADAEGLARTLKERVLADDPRLTLLTNEAATHEAILTAFGRLLRDCAEKGAPGLVHLAGSGSFDARGWPTFVPYDGRAGGAPDLALHELDAMAREARTADAKDPGGAPRPGLVCILDAGWNREAGRVAGRRAVPPPVALSATSPLPQLGGLTISHIYASGKHDDRPLEVEDRVSGQVRGELTLRLVEALAGFAAPPTMREWLRAVGATRAVGDVSPGPSGPASAPEVLFVEGPLPDGALLDNAALLTEAVAGMRAFDQVEPRALRSRLGELIEGHTTRGLPCGWAHFALGFVLESLGDLDGADAALAAAERDTPEFACDAGHHRGRLRLLAGDSMAAVAQLQRVVAAHPRDARSHYLLGLAIRRAVEDDLLRASDRALRTYLACKAPLGDQARVYELLADGKRRRLEGVRLLWVDDNPRNNFQEAEQLRGEGCEIVVVRSTNDALLELQADARADRGQGSRFAAIISDMGRVEWGSFVPDAGVQLALQIQPLGVPVFFYSSASLSAGMQEAVQLIGAAGISSRRTDLVRFVRQVAFGAPP